MGLAWGLPVCYWFSPGFEGLSSDAFTQDSQVGWLLVGRVRSRVARRLALGQRTDVCHYRWDEILASINVRIDDDLKMRAYRELERLGVTPSELMRQALQYVADRGHYPSNRRS